MLRSAAIALAVLLWCSCTREKLGGIEVTLRFMPASTAQCAKVYVTGEDNRTQKPTEPMPRLMRDLNVGIQQSAELGNKVTIEAHGYDTPDCTGPWTDDSNIEEKSFVAGTVQGDVLLVLDGRPVTNSDGGVEICDNGVDDDSDTQTDCRDFDCDGRSCGAPKRCVNFMCQRPTQEVNCTDGMDDDGNGKIDCADDACATKSCTSTDACLLNKRCVGLACGGDPVTCTMPTLCQMPGSGMCLVDGGCGYADRTGPCGDGGTCSAGACTVSFPFKPHNVPQDIPEAEMNGDLTITCATSLDSDTGQWANLCVGQTAPRSFLVNQPGGAPVLRVIALRSLQVTGGTITLTGTKPVAFAVLGNATITGTIVANADGGIDGAGSAGSGCGMSLGSPAVVGTTAGGGGAGHGGQGERGGDDNQTQGTGGNRGAQANDNDLTPLRGGCSGGLGAVPTLGLIAASGGGGGGAFQLSVSGTLNVTGALLANGAGGGGGPIGKGGGGGGGSGGGILLEATTITLTGSALVLTNGGGGGAGATGSTAGAPGEDGHPNNSDAAAGGPGPGEPGGDAQDPGTAAERGGTAMNGSSAAGGGGAGLGRVVVFGACTQTGTVMTSPTLPNGMCTSI